jgi:hypothetical protein
MLCFLVENHLGSKNVEVPERLNLGTHGNSEHTGSPDGSFFILQALFLEQKGHTTCPVTTLEIIDCKMDLWSLGRLGKALQFSSLHFLVLDYCK